MSLLEQASLVITPNAVKESKLYSIKPEDGSGDMDVVRATTATRVNSAGLIETVGLNIPRIDYTNGSCPSILVEPQRTNLVTYSEQFDDASWSKINASVSVNSTTAPDGTLTADLVVNNFSDNQFSRIRKITFITIGQTYTYSCFLKKGNVNYGTINLYDNASFYAFFDLNNGIIGNVSVGITANIEDYGNGWYRCFVTRTAETSGIQFTIAPSTVLNNQNSNINDFIYLWGAQIEAGSYATSYIPTVASAVTRNQDVISKTGISGLINSEEGTVFVEMSALSSTNNYQTITLSDGTLSKAIRFGFQLGTNVFFIESVGATIPINKFNIPLIVTNMNKIAISYKINDVKVYFNGVLATTDTSFSGFSSGVFSKISFDNGIGSGFFLNGNIKSTQLYKTALTDEQCIALTTI